MKSKSELPLHYDPKFKPPFRVGKKQNRVVLDDNGHEVVLFPPGNEIQAHMYVEYLNGINNQFDMKKQKRENIDLLITFQLYLYSKGLIENHDWDFEKQAKKFVKKLARQKRLEDLIEEDVSTVEHDILWNKCFEIVFGAAPEKKVKKVEIQFEFDTAAAFESLTKLKEQLDEIQKNLSEVKRSNRGDKHPLDIDNPLPFVTFEKSDQDVMDEFKAAINTVYPPEGDTPKVAGMGNGRRLYSKCNRGDVVRSYVEESNLNKGFYVLVIQCRNGKKFVVAGDHHAPTYLKPYDQSSDTKKADNEK